MLPTLRAVLGLAIVTSAGCLPDLGGYQVIGGGPLSCDFTRPSVAVLINRFPSPARVEVVELGEAPRPCGPLDARAGLNEYHQASAWVPNSPYLALASATQWQTLDVTIDRVALEAAPTFMATAFDGFAVFDGTRWLAAFPADAGRTATVDAEMVILFDLQDPTASRVLSPSDLGVGSLGSMLDCTVDPIDPSAMLCIRGGLSSAPAASVQARPFAPGDAIVRHAAPADVVLERISAHPGTHVVWRGHRVGQEAEGLWIGDAGGGALRGPYACPQCTDVGDAVPDPARADGFYVTCLDAMGQALLLRGDPTQCAVVMASGAGTPYDLALRTP